MPREAIPFCKTAYLDLGPSYQYLIVVSSCVAELNAKNLTSGKSKSKLESSLRLKAGESLVLYRRLKNTPSGLLWMYEAQVHGSVA